MTILNDEIDWNFDDAVETFDFMNATAPTATTVDVPATAAVDSWMAQLEELLMNDGDNGGGDSDYFHVSDLLLDIPDEGEKVVEDENSPQSPVSPPSVGNDAGNGNGNGNVRVNDKGDTPNFESNCENDKSGDDTGTGDDDDPLTKKRKRQLRNRDAAMRSRERKKKFVKELEMKSRYFEEECRRLERLYQWCYNENQMLRISLQTYGAAMTKPESAVLLLESLLLGSLVWLMVNICLLPQPKLALLNQRAVKLVSVDRKNVENAVPRGKGIKTSQLWLSCSFMRTKRCLASRTKMKSHSAVSCFVTSSITLD